MKNMPGYGDEITWGTPSSFDDPRLDDPLFICEQCGYGPSLDDGACRKCGEDMVKWKKPTRRKWRYSY